MARFDLLKPLPIRFGPSSKDLLSMNTIQSIGKNLHTHTSYISIGIGHSVFRGDNIISFSNEFISHEKASEKYMHYEIKHKTYDPHLYIKVLAALRQVEKVMA